jgi:hypothetical protein
VCLVRKTQSESFKYYIWHSIIFKWQIYKILKLKY